MPAVPKEYTIDDLRAARKAGDIDAQWNFKNHIWNQRIEDAENALQTINIEQRFLLQNHFKIVVMKSLDHDYKNCSSCIKMEEFQNTKTHLRRAILRYQKQVTVNKQSRDVYKRKKQAIPENSEKN